MAVSWSYYDKYDEVINRYMPRMGEGDNQASQICTAVNKLIYKWYNDGDVFDNTYSLGGWCNDLSSYANWLWEYTTVAPILEKIEDCHNYDDYEDLLKAVADELLDPEWLYFISHQSKTGSIYECDGPFKFQEIMDDEDDDEEDWC